MLLEISFQTVVDRYSKWSAPTPSVIHIVYSYKGKRVERKKLFACKDDLNMPFPGCKGGGGGGEGNQDIRKLVLACTDHLIIYSTAGIFLCYAHHKVYHLVIVSFLYFQSF